MVRINTDGRYQYREDQYDRVAAALGENTRSAALDGACEFTLAQLRNLERAAEHPDMTEELAEILSTSKVEVEYHVESGVNVRD